MKFKKTLIVLSVILLVSVLGNIFAFAYSSVAAQQSETSTDIEAAEVKPGEEFVRQDMQKTKSIRFDGKAVELTYQSSGKDVNGKVYDVYTDSSARYNLDENGRVFSYLSGSRKLAAALQSTPKDEWLTEKQLVEIATSYLGTTMTDGLEGFENTNTVYNDSVGTCYVYFNRVYNGFILGEGAYVNVFATGDIGDWHINTDEQYTDFDSARLDGITEQTIAEHVSREIEALDIDSIQGHEIKSVLLVMLNGQFVIQINTVINDGGDSFVKEIYYEI